MEKMITVTQEIYYDVLKLAEKQLEREIFNRVDDFDSDTIIDDILEEIETLSKLKNKLDNVRKEIKEHKPVFNYDDIPF